jgi:hypothetical protein
MALVLLVKSPENLRRCDGTAIAIFSQISLMDSLKLTRDLLADWRILLMLPCEVFLLLGISFPYEYGFSDVMAQHMTFGLTHTRLLHA